VGRPPQKARLVGFGNRGETGNNRLAGNERTLPVARRRRIRRFARLCVAYFPTTGTQKGRTPSAPTRRTQTPKKGSAPFEGAHRRRMRRPSTGYTKLFRVSSVGKLSARPRETLRAGAPKGPGPDGMGLGQRGVRRLLRVPSEGWVSLRVGYTTAVVSGARLLLTQFPLKDGHRALSSVLSSLGAPARAARVGSQEGV
jgi:hypothetical protein